MGIQKRGGGGATAEDRFIKAINILSINVLNELWRNIDISDRITVSHKLGKRHTEKGMIGIDFDYLFFQFKMLFTFGVVIPPFFGGSGRTGRSCLRSGLRLIRYLLFRLIADKLTQTAANVLLLFQFAVLQRQRFFQRLNGIGQLLNL